MTVHRKRLWTVSLRAAIVLLALSPEAAWAHSPIEGAGDFINGIVHPLTSAAHLLTLLGLALLTGLQWPANLRSSIGAFAAFGAAGLFLTIGTGAAQVPPPVLLGVALLTATLASLAAPLSAFFSAALYGVAALTVALDSGVDPSSSMVTWKVLLGTWVAMLAIVFNLGFYLSLSKRPWMRIGIRAVSSWIIAISVIVLAFALKK